MTAIPLAVFAGQAKGKDPAITVGKFAVMLNAATGGRSLEAGKAMEALTKAGVPLRGSLDQPLTERMLADVLAYYDVKATGAADRSVSEGKARSALLLAGGSLASAASIVPADIDICLQESNHGQCVGCCKSQGGTANSCARVCFAINKPSPSEPLP
ncbi:MAG: hypothetical protein ACRD5D_00100 [Candidatus Polarisedimenticolia bacterium]